MADKDDFLTDIVSEKFVGQGAFGCVYKGMWNGDSVALKTIPSIQTPQIIYDEVNAITLLRHRYVVECYGLTEENGTVYMVMEYVEGCPMGSWSRPTVPWFIPNTLKLHLLRTCWQGLEHIHRMNYLHCDLHPGNILIPNDMNKGARICDFGLAKFQSNGKKQLGSKPPYYSAPEIEKDPSDEAAVSQKSDIFSMGLCQTEFLAQKQFWAESLESDELKHPLEVVSFMTLFDDSPFDKIPVMDDFHAMIRTKIVEPAIQWNPMRRSTIWEQLAALNEMEQLIMQKEDEARADKLSIPFLKTEDSDSELSSEEGTSQKRVLKRKLKHDQDANELDYTIEDPDTKSVFQAVRDGNVGIIEGYIQNNPDWKNVSTPHGVGLIHYAVGCSQLEVVRLLISNGVDVNQRGIAGFTPLHTLAVTTDVDMCQLLLSQPNIDVMSKASRGETPFHLAAANDNVQICKVIMDRFPEAVNTRDDNGATPLISAADWNCKDVVELILNTNLVDIDAARKDDFAALQLAAIEGHAEVVQKLIEHGASVSRKDPVTGQTAFLDACQQGHIETAKILMSHKDVEISGCDTEGNSALHKASVRGHKDIVKILMETGQFDVDTRNSMGETPLHRAASMGHRETAELLLQLGADVNARNENQDTPLHLACEESHLLVVGLLLQSNAAVNALNDPEGETPLIKAITSGCTDAVQLLLEQESIDLERGDITALCEAARTGQLDVAEMLVQKGANINANPVDYSCPLYFAAEAGHSEIVEYLLGLEGINVNTETSDGELAIHTAAQNCHTGIVEALLEAGSKADSALLVSAISSNQLALVEKIVHIASLEINKIDCGSGLAPIHAAARAGNNNVMEMLIKNGADVNSEILRIQMGTPH